MRPVVDKHSQSGAALIVSLVLLLIMTLIGLAAVDTVTLESQMAVNSQMRLDVYQIALSNIDDHLYTSSRFETPSKSMNEAVALGGLAIDASIRDPLAVTPAGVATTMTISGQEYNVQACAKNNLSKARREFLITSTATVTGTGSTSIQQQGFHFCM